MIFDGILIDFFNKIRSNIFTSDTWDDESLKATEDIVDPESPHLAHYYENGPLVYRQKKRYKFKKLVNM